jgi:hypothetical protein
MSLVGDRVENGAELGLLVEATRPVDRPRPSVHTGKDKNR